MWKRRIQRIASIQAPLSITARSLWIQAVLMIIISLAHRLLSFTPLKAEWITLSWWIRFRWPLLEAGSTKITTLLNRKIIWDSSQLKIKEGVEGPFHSHPSLKKLRSSKRFQFSKITLFCLLNFPLGMHLISFLKWLRKQPLMVLIIKPQVARARIRW